MKQTTCVPLLSTIFFACNPVHAAQCTGIIQGVSIEPTSGDVILERVTLTTGDWAWWPRFCSVQNTANGIAADSCKVIYASLLAAQAQSRPITFYSHRLQSLKDSGYDLEIVYLKLSSAELALQRVATRVRQGGHDIPSADLRRRFVRSWQNFGDVYRPLADRWTVYENSSGVPKLLEKGP